MSFLAKYRNIFFPTIKDWSSNHDYERNRPDWWKMPIPEFLLFCPVAYRWIMFGMVLMAAILFTVGSFYAWQAHIYILAVILTAIGLRLWWSVYQKLKTWQYAKFTNLYDIFFRDSIIK